MGHFILFTITLASGSLLTFVTRLALRKKTVYTRLSLDDIIDYLQHVNQEVLQVAILDILEKSSSKPPRGEDSYVYRRDLRLVLDLLRDYTERMVQNSARIRYVADADQLQIKQRKLDYTTELLKSIGEMQESHKQFQLVARYTIRKIWLWSLTGFANRTWGPVPDPRNLPVTKLLDSYNRVKRAIEAYALFYGEAGTFIAAEIRTKM